jgi:hypothetical protein
MKLDWLKIAVGQNPLPSNSHELQAFIEFAEREHILAQIAHAHNGEPDGKLRNLFDGAILRADYDRRMLCFEANRIERALLDFDIKVIVLKGGSYALSGHKASHGRRVSDLDIMVAEHDLSAVEKWLIMAGWGGDKSTDNDYDQAYYRNWMHELPPMRHQKRRTIIDVHHRLTPKTARIKLDHEKMIEAAARIEETTLYSFTSIDRFLHAAYHIFYDGDLDTPARSLIEIYHLFEGLDDNAVKGLIARANTVGALKPLIISLLALKQFFASDRAKALLNEVGKINVSKLLFNIMAIEITGGACAPIAKFILYVRGHWLRMPFFMLLRHLLTKTWRRKAKKLPQDFLDRGLMG